MAQEKMPDSKTSIGFLKEFHPDSLWTLTALAVDKKGIITKTFLPSEEAEALEWIDMYNGTHNMYFQVNPSIEKMNQRPKKEHIKALHYLHIDIDPKKSVDLDEERERILDLLTDDLPGGVPKPSSIVFSGGGYQAFWKLKEPAEINGDVSLAEMYEVYSQTLEVLFKADSCHNIDRMMRLPGTVNIPDKGKREKGRKRELSKKVYFKDLEYSLEDFPQPQPENKFQGKTQSPVDLSNLEVKRISDLGELDEWNVPDRLKVIIAQGEDSEKLKEGDNSRSGWLFDVCCNLLRLGVPDEVVYGIITDSSWGISSSVLDKGVLAHKYALRQIESAKEKIVDPNLYELNQKYAVVKNYYGKCRVILEEFDHVFKRNKITAQSFDDFRNSYSNEQVQVGVTEKGIPKTKKKGHWWLDHPQRRQYDTITFAPGHEVEGAYNLWKGFSVKPVKGDKHLSFMKHIFDNVCSQNKEYYQYLLNWMARAVQFPDQQGEVAIVLRGRKGTGKSFFVEKFGCLFGCHFLHISNAKHLVGNFNAHLQNCVVLFADEAFYAGDKRHESVLKTLITESQNLIERKGVDASPTPNFVHLIMASNEDWVVPASKDERRYLVLDMGECSMQVHEYFAKIQRDLESGGYENLLHYLQCINISEWNHRQIPKTEALLDQMRRNMPEVIDPLLDWLYDGITPGDDSSKCGDPSCIVLTNAADECGLHSRKLLNDLTRLGVFMQSPPKPQQTSVGNKSTSRAYKLKPLAELRKQFADYFEGAWPEDDNLWNFTNEEETEIPF
ncbi:MAG: DUF5906 domain-containing protein [Pseudomonadota bacterium]|nr:DUF5906 domain-containing protein [Pseudomonadota bacterium]